MLKRVEIKGFRSCQDVVLDDLGGLTALIGRNAAGKTAILKAIEWAARSATAPEFHRLQYERGSGHTLSVCLQVTLEGKELRYTIEHTFTGPPGLASKALPISELIEQRSGVEQWSPLIDRKGITAILYGDGESRQLGVGLYAPSLYAVTTFLTPDDPFLALVNSLIAFLKSVRYYPFDEPSESREPELVGAMNYQQWLSSLRMPGDTGQSVTMCILHLQRDQDRFDKLKSLLGGDGLGIVDNIEVNPLQGSSGGFGREGSLDPEGSDFFQILFQQGRRAGGSGARVRFALLSLGTRRLLRIILAYVMDQSTVMLIEHPEDGIHFGLARKLIHVLRSCSDHVQTILTSHSPDVLNVLKPGDVRLVALNDGATQVRALSDVEMKAAANYIKEEGTLTDFLRIVEED